MIKEYLCFDDVLLIPKYSSIKSRGDVDLNVNISGFKFAHPVIAANMASIISTKMIEEIIHEDGLAIDHRFQDFDNQLLNYNKMQAIFGGKVASEHYSISTGVKIDEIDNVKRFIDVGGRIINIDVAHMDSIVAIDFLKLLRKLPQRKNLLVIAGSIATSSAAKRLFEHGADVARAGLGAGSICSTRIETGNGVPSFTMCEEIKEHLKKDQYFIVDGGLKNAGDLTKGLCFADMTMAGNLFSGCTETPGDIIEKDGERYKIYQGSSTYKIKNVEGVKGLVKVKGNYLDILDHLLQGLRSGCSYQDAHDLKELKDNPQFCKITQASRKESLPHSLEKIIG